MPGDEEASIALKAARRNQYVLLKRRAGSSPPRKNDERPELFVRDDDDMTTTQVGQDNIAIIKRGFEAFAAGNMATLAEVFDAKATWHGTSAGILKGVYQGRDAIFAMFGQLHQETAGTFSSEPVAIAAAGDKVFVQTVVTGERNGRKLDDGEVLVFALADGRVREVHLYTENYPSAASFWT
jgi:ketosteroid isomerase-like protein